MLKTGVLNDPDPRVKLAALLVLADQQSDRAADASVGKELAKKLLALDANTEKNLADATLAACVAHAGPVLAELAKMKDKTWTKEALATVERIAASYAAKAPGQRR